MSSYRALGLASTLILTLAGALASCSNSGSTAGSGGTSSTTGSATGGTGGTTAAPCPASAPAPGSACPTSGQACEYGGDAERNCTTVASCYGGMWSVSTPPATCGQQPAVCPATFGAVPQGMTCPASSPLCEYPEGFCGCEPCQGDGGGLGAIWNCNAWATVGAACPNPRPRLGEACSAEGTECDYGHCCSPPSLGPYMKCQGGAWIPWENGACSCGIATCP